MKKFFALLAALAVPSQSFAIVGGPFDNGFHHGLGGGTYEAIYRFQNGNGIVRFSDANDGTFLNGSVSLVFYKGIIYQGNAAGSVNPKEGYATGMSSGVTTGFQNDQNQTQNLFVSGSARNIGICNANWFGHVKENGYRLRFSGEGVMHFFGQLDQYVATTATADSTQGNFFDGFQTVNDSTRTVTITDNGTGTETRTSTGATLPVFDAEGNPVGTITTSSGFNGTATRNDVSTNGPNSTFLDNFAYNQNASDTNGNSAFASTGGEQKDFESVGHRVKIDVRGSRVSFGAVAGNVPLNGLVDDNNAPIEISGITIANPTAGFQNPDLPPEINP